MPRMLDHSLTEERLTASGVTGYHRSHDRANNLRKIDELAGGEPEATFGLSGVGTYSAGEVLSFLAELTGCSPDIAACEGYDTIDPQRTIAGLIAAGKRLGDAAARGALLLTVTGHPTGLLEFYMHIVAAYRRAGGKILRLMEEERFPIGRSKHAEVRYTGGVGCLADWGSLRHTHSPAAMEVLLEGQPWPDLVLGDHGFAGAAIERGIPTIAVMDINDPALAIAHAEKRDVAIVPMDDNRPAGAYEPAWDVVVDAIEKTASDQEL